MAKQALQSTSQQSDRAVPKLAAVVCAELNKKFGVGTVMRAADAVNIQVPRMSTGSIAFDQALGGGWPQNRVSEIVGRESSGKTTTVLKTIAFQQAMNPEFTTAWIDAEGLDLAWARQLGVDLSRVYLVEDNIMEVAYGAAEDFAESRSVDLIVVDSYPQLVSQAEDEAKSEDWTTAVGARRTNSFMRRYTRRAMRSLTDPTDRPVTLLFINQWRDRVGVIFGDPRTTSGGQGKNYWCSVRVDVVRTQDIKEGKGDDQVVYGQTMQLRVFKNKASRPRQHGDVDYYFAPCVVDGIEYDAGTYNTPKEILAAARDLDIVSFGGGVFTYRNMKFQGKAGWAQAILSDPALRTELWEAILHGPRIEPEPEPPRRRRRVAEPGVSVPPRTARVGAS